ncbi:MULTISPECIES: teichoic acid D-Ala incorporation-associated protein DltX [Bacillus]|jgi:hypothetical protein|uniref:Teichoic acid D-Ala incorporation-associated protein DltX n=4 Tax=Bacillus amyloliquefaciens group TaxID=1938374 RepID=A0A1D9PQ60_BACVE|nr:MULTISPECIES: teichoic acid D-Ala incorporation-associated protein DltX [Bacillus]AIU75313.1 cytochrome C553 [Bacillus subtilis]ARM29661.1 teichoic acid D-Ala incorporation-associated protein DltX [Bacillus vallismortis]MBL3612550.1 teichoic acid D-Ala incorporation-associated protein DltX [Bacillus sp. RHFS18]UXZ17776.1 teichoic acid D-Ala incorporation-associated protein DltX [Bacillus siamensis]COD26446.1 D-Ala-teichoic acid biosynthesis protein [Streptococcus pneumoniae]SLB01968.1 D-Al
MMQKLKRAYENTLIKWTFHTGFYFLILVLLFWMYGFHTANTGTYIYNDF